MKIYSSCFTRNNYLETYHNLPEQDKFVLSELNQEDMSHSIGEGFVWKVHSHEMYSYSYIRSIYDREIDARKIPFIVSYVMDKEAAECIMKCPRRLFELNEELENITYVEAINFHTASVKEKWSDNIFRDSDLKVVAEKEKALDIVKAAVEMLVKKDNKKFVSFVYGNKSDLIVAFQMLPLEFRMSLSFAAPFPGGGAAVCDLNMTTAETMHKVSESCFDGFPLISRVVAPDELEISECTQRVVEELERLYDLSVELTDVTGDMMQELLLLSYLNEYNAEKTAESKKHILKYKNKTDMLHRAKSLLKDAPSEELLELLKSHKKAHKPEKKQKSAVKTKVKKRKRVKENVLLIPAAISAATLLVVLPLLLLDFNIIENAKYVKVEINFHVGPLLTYMVGSMSGFLACLCLCIAKKRGGRK